MKTLNLIINLRFLRNFIACILSLCIIFDLRVSLFLFFCFCCEVALFAELQMASENKKFSKPIHQLHLGVLYLVGPFFGIGLCFIMNPQTFLNSEQLQKMIPFFYIVSFLYIVPFLVFVFLKMIEKRQLKVIFVDGNTLPRAV